MFRRIVAGWMLVWCCCWAAGAEERAMWVLVTAPGLREAAGPLCERRKGEGLEVVTLRTTDVLSEREIAAGEGEALRGRIAALCRGRKAYVLLLGSMVRGVRQDVQTSVPALPGTVERMKGVPSDNGYGCAAGQDMPGLAVGRLPARDAAQAKAMVEKILAYEDGTRPGEWRRRVTMLVGDPGAASFAERMVANVYVQSLLQASAAQIDPAWRIRALIHIPGSRYFVPDGSLHDVSRGYLEAGQAFIFYMGHSWEGGLASGQARFLDRADWGSMKSAHAGVFVSCGCFGCQWDTRGAGGRGEGYGLAAMRNPGGPPAVIGATGESYAAMGKLAFEGLMHCLTTQQLPPRLGDCYLMLKKGIAEGPMDAATFWMFDHADGSNGQIPLDVQRREHLEMWTLLGDPAMRMPVMAGDIALHVPTSIAAGERFRITGTLPARLAGARLKITVMRPMEADREMRRIRDGSAGGTKGTDTAAGIEVSVQSEGARFEAQAEAPAGIGEEIIVRAYAAKGMNEAMGAARMKQTQAAGR